MVLAGSRAILDNAAALSMAKTAPPLLAALTIEIRRALEGSLGAENHGVALDWALRLLTLRCLAARGLVDRDLAPPEPTVRPSEEALRRCEALLSGAAALQGNGRATDALFRPRDTLGWAYQAWNNEEKVQLFEALRVKTIAKVGGADLIPATCIYTPAYLTGFLVENALGARYLAMHPRSPLGARLRFHVAEADRLTGPLKPVRELTFLDPACGSGHFLLEAFDLFHALYLDEGALTDPAAIVAAILEHNLHGLDLDPRAIAIASLSLRMRAEEIAPGAAPARMNLVCTGAFTPPARDELEAYLAAHPIDAPLAPALRAIFEGLALGSELGSLLRIEEPIARAIAAAPRDALPPLAPLDASAWKHACIERLRVHVRARGAGSPTAIDLLSRRYDVVTMNPPYVGFRKLSAPLKERVADDPLATLDLYVAFLSRGFSLLTEGGCLAAITPSSWTTSSRTVALRQAMLDEGSPRVVVSLGQRVFESAPLLFVSLAIVQRGPPVAGRSLATLRPAPFSGDEGLLRAIEKGAKRWPIDVLAALPTVPFFPIAPLSLLRVADAQPTVHRFFTFTDGIWTGSNERDFREAWEVLPGDAAWVPTSGGQGYARWYAPFSRRMRAADAEAWSPFTARSFALEYARVAGGKLAARVIQAPSAAIAGAVTLVPRPGTSRARVLETAAIFNARLGTVWLRTLTSGLNFNPGYAGRIPLGEREPPPALEDAVLRIVTLKRALAEANLACDDLDPGLLAGPGPLGARAALATERALDLTLRALDEEAHIERLLQEHLALDAEACDEIAIELGEPVAALGGRGARTVTLTTDARDQDEDADDDDDDDAPRTLPAESELEALSRSSGVCPRVLCSSNDLPPLLAARVTALRRGLGRAFAEDYLALQALRLFGHRFPREHPSPPPRDPARVLPIVGGVGPTLRERLAPLLAEDGVDEGAIEALLDKTLDRWLLVELARHQVTRFGRRPILWQVQLGRFGAAKKPGFAALLHIHHLDASTLPRLRSEHLAPMLAREDRAARRDAELARENLLDLDRRLASVITDGFACAELPALLAREPLDAWTSPDGRAPHPRSREAFLAHERRYHPDVAAGVRVNIAPLQRAGVLAAPALADKDVAKAITDRAVWRAEERARCRAGRAVRPSWWPASAVSA